jgi:hypothetical protein
MPEDHAPSTISLSNNMLARDFGYGLILEYRKRLYLTFFSNAFLVVVFAVLLIAVIQYFFTSDFYAILSFLPAVVGLFFLYHYAVRYLDSAEFLLTKEKVEVKRGPVPPLKRLSIETKQIAKVFQQRRIVAWKSSWGMKWFGFRFETWPESDDVRVRYIVGIITVDGRKIDLLREIPSAVDAKTLRENIQQRLGIAHTAGEDDLYALFVGSGFWNRITHSSSAGTFNGSPLSFLLLGAVFVVQATVQLASGEIRKGRWSNTMISSSSDPTSFTVSVLLLLAITCYLFYRGWRRFMNPSGRGGFA